jgi:hypothetical protein
MFAIDAAGATARGRAMVTLGANGGFATAAPVAFVLSPSPCSSSGVTS